MCCAISGFHGEGGCEVAGDGLDADAGNVTAAEFGKDGFPGRFEIIV
jgi:hypothetical protein